MRGVAIAVEPYERERTGLETEVAMFPANDAVQKSALRTALAYPEKPSRCFPSSRIPNFPASPSPGLPSSPPNSLQQHNSLVPATADSKRHTLLRTHQPAHTSRTCPRIPVAYHAYTQPMDRTGRHCNESTSTARPVDEPDPKTLHTRGRLHPSIR